MRITGIRLTNFGRFRGDQELALGPGVHAIVAADADDPRRSNWLGKTTLLAAIRWALHGVVPWATLDDAISRGEREMAVDLELDDGTFVSRSKPRGKSAVLRVVVSSGATERELFGDPAQDELNSRVGFSADDFGATVWMEQKAAARFVAARPADRTAMVAEWLSLAPLQDAAARVAARVAAEDRKLDRIRTQLEVMPAETPSIEELRAEVAGWETRLQEAKAAAADIAARAKEAAEYDQAVARRDRLEAERRELEEETARAPKDVAPEQAAEVTERLTLLREASRAARAEHDRLIRLAAGKFDGKCPVICGPCPVADQLLSERQRIQDATKLAVDAVAKTERDFRTAEQESAEVRSRRQEWSAWQARMQRCMDRVKDLEKDSARDAAVLARGARTRPGVCVDVSEPAGRLAVAKERLAAAERATAERGALLAEADRLGSEVKVLRIAARILGRGGAQRRLAQEALGRIESTANRMLRGSGIELTVGLVFGRELQGPAEVCDCGTAFPKSATARACAACGEPRGRKRDDKLYVELSDRSGAAEDLAGVALQVAAARWLRAARGAAWGVLALDEPFGALDAAHRPALARALLSLVREGFEQAFVIAHSADTLEAFPHRILIRSTGAWSTAVVE